MANEGVGGGDLSPQAQELLSDTLRRVISTPGNWEKLIPLKDGAKRLAVLEGRDHPVFDLLGERCSPIFGPLQIPPETWRASIADGIREGLDESMMDRDWQRMLLRDEKDRPLPILANALIAIRVLSRGAFAYDDMKRAVIVTGPGRPLEDVDVIELQDRIQREAIPRMGKDAVFDAVTMEARRHRFNPVRQWLERLRWDKVERLDGLFPRYFGSPKSEYERRVGRMFLVAMVARVMEPGCKADYMVTIEGPQGIRKSTACSILGGEWYSDNLPDLGSKDASQHLRGKWVIEASEMHAMTRAETTQMKAFLTRTEERYRPSYGRTEVIEPRMCVFVGTTNRETYLKDETGGRRFWPIRAGIKDIIDTDALKADRDQLFAEAMAAYLSGEKWWPDGAFEAEFIQPEQEARFDIDVWEEAVIKYLNELPNPSQTTVYDVARFGLFIETPRIGTAEQRRISSALTRRGYIRGGQDTNGRVLWVKPRPQTPP